MNSSSVELDMVVGGLTTPFAEDEDGAPSMVVGIMVVSLILNLLDPDILYSNIIISIMSRAGSTLDYQVK